MPATITLVRGGPEGRGNRHELVSFPVTIGREVGNTIVIEEPWVSRCHLKIESTAPGRLELVDCSSFHETYVNGERVSRVVLRHGDVVAMGAPSTPGRCIELKFLERDEAPAPAPRAPVAPARPSGGESYVTHLDTQLKPLIAQMHARGVDPVALREFQSAMDRALQDVRVLYEVSGAINSELELEKVLDLILIHVLRASGGDKGIILLLDPDAGGLKPVAARTLAGPLDQAQQSQLSLSYCQRALDTRQPVVAMDTGADPAARSQSIVAYAISSIIAAPLFARQEPLGVLYVDAKAELRQFTKKDVEFFSALANQSAVAIQNARAYERVVSEKRAIESQYRELKVQMDEAEKTRQVDAITESEYFVALRNKADQIRQKF